MYINLFPFYQGFHHGKTRQMLWQIFSCGILWQIFGCKNIYHMISSNFFHDKLVFIIKFTVFVMRLSMTKIPFLGPGPFNLIRLWKKEKRFKKEKESTIFIYVCVKPKFFTWRFYFRLSCNLDRFAFPALFVACLCIVCVCKQRP